MSTYSGMLKVEKTELAQTGQVIRSAAQEMLGGVGEAQRRINALDLNWSGRANLAYMPNFSGLVHRAEELAQGLIRLGGEVARIGEQYEEKDSVTLAFEYVEPGASLQI